MYLRATLANVIASFRHKGLKELFETGQTAKVDPKLQQRCADLLDALEAAIELNDVNLPGSQFHRLKGKPVRYSIHVNGPWTITFEWDAPKASRVDFGAISLAVELKVMSTEEFAVDRNKITRAPVHPGVFFERNILPEFRRQRRTIGEIATLLNVSRQTLHRVMAGDGAVTPDMAVRLGKLCGNGPDLWLNLQARYDAWEATHRLAKDLKKIPTLREA